MSGVAYLRSCQLLNLEKFINHPRQIWLYSLGYQWRAEILPEGIIQLKDIVNVGPVVRRSGTNWKSVYRILSAIVAEYIFGEINPGPDDEISQATEMLFTDATKTSKEWLENMKEYDPLDDLLDSIEFQEDDKSFEKLRSSIRFVLKGEKSSIEIEDLSVPFSQKFLRFHDDHGSVYALIYSQVDSPVYKPIQGPGQKIDYIEFSDKILKETTGIQANPLGSCVKLVDQDKFFTLTEDLSNADEDQMAAISADTDRNLLVVAGAGSGKTRSLIGRLCYLHLVKGIPLRRMAILTYMRKATYPLIKSVSEQLSEAYIKIGAETMPEEVSISTIDAFFKRLIEFYWADMGFTAKPVFNFSMKEDVKLNILATIINENNYPIRMELPELKRHLENYANGLSVNMPGIDNILRSYVEWQIENHEIFEFFCSSYILKMALVGDSLLKDKICESFDCILIDEFQDINKLQNEIFSTLYHSNIHFTLVGDDDQTIYTWRGSDVGIIRNMQKDNGVKTVYLTVNYRNNPHIVEAGNSVLEKMGGRSKVGKKIIPYQTNGPKIRVCSVSTDYNDLANEISKLYDPNPDAEKICVLSRRSDSHETIRKALKSLDIPSVITKSNSDIDVSPGYKILKALAFIFCRYDLKANYDTLNEMAGERYTNMELMSFINRTKTFVDKGSDVDIKVADIVTLSEYVDVRMHQAFSFEEMVSNYCRAYAEIVEKNTSEDRIVNDACLLQFLNYVSNNDWTYPRISKDLLESIFSRFEKCYLTNVATFDSSVEDVNIVVISTIHSSKGLEYDTVFVVGMDHGLFPNTKKIDADYNACIEDIRKLEESRRSLKRLRNNLDQEKFDAMMAECTPESFKAMDPEMLEELIAELRDSEVDIVELTMDGVDDYLRIYNTYISPELETYNIRIRNLNLNKRSIQERYYKCEDVMLSENDDTVKSMQELESIKAEIKSVDASLSNAKAEMDEFKSGIKHLIFMDGICKTVKQYAIDIHHLDHMEQLIAALKKERDEKICEEKRSFYVSISRARNLLYLCSSFGSAPSEFISLINTADREPYKMTTRADDEQEKLIKAYKIEMESEMRKRKPDQRRMDGATSSMISNLTDEVKAKCESQIKGYLVKYPEFKALTGDAKEYFEKALSMDYLGKLVNIDLSDAVLANLMRAGEEFIRSHTTENIRQIIADEKFCHDLRNDLLEMRSRFKTTIPAEKYLIENFTVPVTKNYSRFDIGLKQLIIGIYIIFSGKWPEMTERYRDNWDVAELAIDPEVFIIHGLDLCNLRNKTTHEKMDETWKNDQIPYAYECLRKMTVSLEG